MTLAWSDRTLRFGEAVTAALLGVDALYAAEQADGGIGRGSMPERLVVLNMSETHRPEPFRDYAEARERFGALAAEAASLPVPDRARYYAQLCDSTAAFTFWREGRLPFRNQLGRFLQIPAEPVPGATLDTLRDAMRSLLNGLGYTGDLAAQFAAWEERHRVPPESVVEVLDALMAEAWDRTTERLAIPTPKSDGMRAVAETGVPYNARCDYRRREVRLNIDPVLTRPGLKHLAVHECYPGHYVQFKLREVWYRQGTAAADGLLSVVNSASSCVFEGIADNGIDVIEWVEGDDDRIAALMTRYRAAIGTGAAWRLHALGWPGERVRDWLRAQTLVGGEGWVANRMRFIAAPSRAALIWSYWWGEASVAPVWRRVPPERRPEFLRYLYGRMHSPQSVAMFAGARGTEVPG